MAPAAASAGAAAACPAPGSSGSQPRCSARPGRSASRCLQRQRSRWPAEGEGTGHGVLARTPAGDGVLLSLAPPTLGTSQRLVPTNDPSCSGQAPPGSSKPSRSPPSCRAPCNTLWLPSPGPRVARGTGSQLCSPAPFSDPFCMLPLSSPDTWPPSLPAPGLGNPPLPLLSLGHFRRWFPLVPDSTSPLASRWGRWAQTLASVTPKPPSCPAHILPTRHCSGRLPHAVPRAHQR